jgi:hypothetical protein
VREAAAHLQRHAAIWAPATGPDALLHEHWGYMALQYVRAGSASPNASPSLMQASRDRYRIFAELLEQAARAGANAPPGPAIPASGDHAGYYYHMAAQYTVLRTRAAAVLVSAPPPDPSSQTAPTCIGTERRLRLDWPLTVVGCACISVGC